MGRKPAQPQETPIAAPSFTLSSEKIPTGWISFDAALRGGIPFGVVTVIGGRPDVGKTNLCTHIAANAVKAGYRVVYLDTEGRLAANAERLLARGLSPEDFDTKIKVISGLHTVEGVSGLIRGFLVSKVPETDIEREISEFGEPQVIILDSIASLTTLRAIKSKQSEDVGVGLGDLARSIQDEFKDIFTYYVPRRRVAFVLVTQRRTAMVAMRAVERLYLTSFLEHNAAVIVTLMGEDEKEDESYGAFKSPAQSSSYQIKKFKKILFRFNKNHVGYPTAEGGGRIFLIDLPQLGVHRGDFDTIFEIVAFGAGRAHGLGFLRRRGDEFFTPSGLSFTLRGVYTNPELRKRVIDECAPLLYDALTKFYEGSWMLDAEIDEGGEE